MRIHKIGLLSALALLAGSAPALAQQVIQAPGIVIILNPAAAQADPAAAAMLDPFAMIRQMNAQMNAQMAQMNQVIEAAQQRIQATAGQPALPAAFGNGAAGVFVTTISTGSQSCTQRIVYPGNGAPAEISVSQTGNACAALHLNPQTAPAPAALPATIAPQSASPRTIQVRNDAASQPAPILLADRGN